MFEIVTSHSCMQFQGKYNESNLRKWQKAPNFRLDYGSFSQNLSSNIFFCVWIYLYQILNIVKLDIDNWWSKLKKMAKKTHFGPNFGPMIPNSSRNFFFKNLSSSVTRYYGQLSSCTISKKTNDSILRKFKAGRTNRRTDGQTDRRADGQTD